jgi:hypothetical protein
VEHRKRAYNYDERITVDVAIGKVDDSFSRKHRGGTPRVCLSDINTTRITTRAMSYVTETARFR